MDWGRLSNWRVAGLCLALLALVLKAAIPAGFMLAKDAHNRIAIVLCTGHGSVEATLDLTTGEITQNGAPGENKGEIEKAKADSPCAFAAIAQADTALDGFVLAAPYAQANFVSRTPHEERPSIAPTGPPLPARGPPSLA